MSTLFHSRVERGSFGDLLSEDGISRLELDSSPSLDQLLRRPPPVGQSVVAVWPFNPEGTGQLPHLLICPDGFDTDWAAWITTYAVRIRPFSAYMRLATHGELAELALNFRNPTLGRLHWPIVGLILGEALAASRLPDKALDILPGVAFASTLSFAMFRAVALYSKVHNWTPVVSGWAFAREVTSQRPRAIDKGQVSRVCATVIQAAGVDQASRILGGAAVDPRAQTACRELIEAGGGPPGSLLELSDFRAIEQMLYGPREDRVVAVGNVIRNLGVGDAAPPEVMSLMLGYLMSRVAPGTLQHASVLAPALDRYPTALLWYGFCAGFGDVTAEGPSRDGRAGVELPVSARRVARDLLRPDELVSSPSCDVSILELAALSRTGGDPTGGIIASTQGTVMVELLPGVLTAVAAGAKSSATDEPVRHAPTKTTAALLERDLREAVQRIERVRRELVGPSRDEASEAKERQRTLFSGPKRKKKE